MDTIYQSHGELVKAATEDPDANLILVMGETRSGKTNFINLISRSNLLVGSGPRSCTRRIQLSRPFDHDECKVILIDTPGLENNVRDENEVLRELALFLSDIHKKDMKLQGMIYVQSVTSHWKSATAKRCFTIFQKLCGDSLMPNVVIMSTARGCLSGEARIAREARLTGPGWHFKEHLDYKTTFVAHKNLETAKNIITHILELDELSLQIQIEMHKEEKEFHETTIGSFLTHGSLEDIFVCHEKQLNEISLSLSRMRVGSPIMGWNGPSYHGHMSPYGACVPGLGWDGRAIMPPHSVLCNICGDGIIGVRYKCTQCPSYDACTNCYYYIPEVHPIHSFIRVDVSASPHPYHAYPSMPWAMNQNMHAHPALTSHLSCAINPPSTCQCGACSAGHPTNIEAGSPCGGGHV